MRGELLLTNADLNFDSILKYGLQGTRLKIVPSYDASKTFVQGVARSRYWRFQRVSEKRVEWEVLGRFKNADESDDERVLHDFLQLDVDLPKLYKEWSADEKFRKVIADNRKQLEGIRVLKQDLLEVLVRASLSRLIRKEQVNDFIERFCELYGESIEIVTDDDEFTCYDFPTYGRIISNLDSMEATLKGKGFGFRAHCLVNVLRSLDAMGGLPWLETLRSKNYRKATKKLQKHLTSAGNFISECLSGFGLALNETVLTSSRAYNITSLYYLPEFPRARTVCSSFDDDLRACFTKKFPKYTLWAMTALIASDELDFEQDLMTPAKRRCMRRTMC